VKKTVAVLLVFCFFAFIIPISAFGLSSKASVVINGQTGEVIFSQNKDEKLAMASTTKIMTALLLCESGNLSREVTVTDEMVKVEGTSLGLKAGDKITLKDLLYGMMLSSGNDAANAIAVYLSGSNDNFSKCMNEKAKSLGLQNTSFETPSGLDGENHYTTALELALITKEAMKYEEFRNAVSSKSATLCFGNPKSEKTITNHNKLLNCYSDVVGVKTGYTKKAGRCLVSAAKQGERYVIAVTLNDGDDWNDHRELLDLGFSCLKESVVSCDKGELCVPVVGGNTESLDVNIKDKTFFVTEQETITTSVNLPNMIYAPIKKGDSVGTVSYYKDNELLCREELVANKNIEKNEQIKRTYFSIVLDILRRINERQ